MFAILRPGGVDEVGVSVAGLRVKLRTRSVMGYAPPRRQRGRLIGLNCGLHRRRDGTVRPQNNVSRVVRITIYPRRGRSALLHSGRSKGRAHLASKGFQSSTPKSVGMLGGQ
jgi:hypothetical protein